MGPSLQIWEETRFCCLSRPAVLSAGQPSRRGRPGLRRRPGLRLRPALGSRGTSVSKDPYLPQRTATWVNGMGPVGQAVVSQGPLLSTSRILGLTVAQGGTWPSDLTAPSSRLTLKSTTTGPPASAHRSDHYRGPCTSQPPAIPPISSMCTPGHPADQSLGSRMATASWRRTLHP